jgi:hypothetical protein
MNATRAMTVAAVLAVVATASPATAAGQSRRLNDDEIRALLERIEQDADRFKKSLHDAIDRGSLDGTWEEDEIERFVDNFEDATDRLEDRFGDHDAATPIVREVLSRAAFLEDVVASREVGPVAQGDWRTLRGRLDQLAAAYGLRWDWMLGGPALADPARRLTDAQLERLVKDIEETTDRFRDSLDDAIDHSSLKDTATEREADGLLDQFDKATDRLRDRTDDGRVEPAGLVGRVLRQGERIDLFMARHSMGPRAEDDWLRLRTQLRELAEGYGIERRMARW